MKAIAGLDLNASWAKQVVIDTIDNQFCLKNLAMYQIKDAKGVIATHLEVVSAITGANVFTKIVRMNVGMSDSTMEAQAWEEVSQHSPELRDGLSLDFAVLSPCADSSMVEVLLVACRKQHIESRVAEIKSAGFRPVIMDVEYYALARSFQLIKAQLPELTKKDIVALINIGPQLITLVVIAGQEIIFTRDKSFMVSSSLVPQLRHLMQFFFSTTSHEKIHYLVLSGEGAMLSGIDEIVSQQLAIPTVVANPAAFLKIGPVVDSTLLAEFSPALMIACGLSMRGVAL